MLVHLHPLIVMGHFLLSLLAVAVAVVVAFGAWELSRGRRLAFHPDGRHFATGSLRTDVWDFPTHSQVSRLDQFPRHIPAMAFAPDGRLLASGSTDGTVRLWRLPSWR